MPCVEDPVLAPCLVCLYYSGETNEALNIPEHGNTSKGICIMVTAAAAVYCYVAGANLLWTAAAQDMLLSK